MKRSKESTSHVLGRFLERYFNPSKEQVEAAGDRVLQRLHADDTGTSECAAIESDWVRPQRTGWLRTAALAAIAVILMIVSALLWRPTRVDVVATSADGLRYGAGQMFRSGGGTSTIVMLADGSRVEMRAGSEATVERAADGLRVRLTAGSIIVNAAKQAAGKHLYVLTRDVSVSVVGTVFLVEADDQGSHVAVIQGEVHVKQGTVEKSLRRGEQASSGPKPETLAIEVKIGWSREAAAYLAMLHEEMAQSIATRQAEPRTAPVPAEAPRSASTTPQFEEASIRPCPKDFQTPQGMRGGGSNSIRLSPGRLDALCMTVATLVRTAYRPLHNNSLFPGVPDSASALRVDTTYGLGMENGTRVRGGPDWVRSEKYTIAAVAGGATDARTLQNVMLMALLESRFQLKTHIEVEQIPVLALTIAKGGLKMKRAGLESCVQPPDPAGPQIFGPAEARRDYDSIRRGANPACGARIFTIGPNVVQIGGAASINSLVGQLSVASEPPVGFISDTTNGLLVINKTGIPDTDTFNYLLEYAIDEGFRDRIGRPPDDRNADIPRGPDVFEALEKQLGLKLERAQGSREYVVIDHIERPSPN
jgi:uncharacterized protein (TIGR03435 family)